LGGGGGGDGMWVVLFFLSSPRFRFLSSCTCNFELSHRLVIHVNPH
jgi:hypothetical protein